MFHLRPHVWFVLAGTVALAAAAQAASDRLAQIEQTAPYGFDQNSQVSLDFARFDAHGGSRELVRVIVEMRAQARIILELTNHDDVPIETTILVSETVGVYMPATATIVPVVLEEAVLDEGLLPPGETCDYGGVQIFGDTATRSFTDAADLAAFTGLGTTEIIVAGSGAFSYGPISLVTLANPLHEVRGTTRVIYEYLDTPRPGPAALASADPEHAVR